MKPTGSLRLVRLALVTGALTLSAGCTKSRCSNQATVGLPSPDGAMIAFVFSRRCSGAPSSTDVSVFPMNTSLHDEAGNVLVAPGDQPVKIAWHGPRRLAVSGFANPSFRLDRPQGGVSAEFP